MPKFKKKKPNKKKGLTHSLKIKTKYVLIFQASFEWYNIQFVYESFQKSMTYKVTLCMRVILQQTLGVKCVNYNMKLYLTKKSQSHLNLCMISH